uniref:Uncharacterized protein n=1 Tax=Arundo donax TaxID=35708 RepID=A0A0A9G6B6_ARUDO
MYSKLMTYILSRRPLGPKTHPKCQLIHQACSG